MNKIAPKLPFQQAAISYVRTYVRSCSSCVATQQNIRIRYKAHTAHTELAASYNSARSATYYMYVRTMAGARKEEKAHAMERTNERMNVPISLALFLSLLS